MTRPPSADDLKKLFAQAADVAQSVPQNLQEAAFQRALDALLGTSSAQPATPPGTKPDLGKRGGNRDARPPQDSETEENPVELLIEQLDRTELAQVMAGRKVLDRALLVLRAAHHHGIDVLTPGEIARILTEKFRERTTDAAVRMAIGNETEYVDRVRQGTGFGYRLMAPGERYLDSLGSSTPSAGRASQGRRSAVRKKTAKSSPAESAEPVQGASPAERTRARKATGRPGPKAMMETLIADGYFNEPRLLGEILTHVEQKRGFKYTAQDVAAALARLLRAQELDRDRDANGQYSYRKPG